MRIPTGRQTAVLSLLLLVAAACTKRAARRWDDFTAYYNTFFNAKTLVEKNERIISNQALVINAERPIKLFETPNKTGQADFEKAVLKGAAILRDHPDSKWTDDALLLIGKSYFYLTQYYSAEQKFDEALVASKDPVILQQAVFWKGRVYLETRRLREGQEYLTRRIAESELRWLPVWSAQTRALLAQLAIENADPARGAAELAAAVRDLQDPVLRGKAWFLLGQLAERRRDLRAARDAFSRVTNPRLDYELRFRAKLRLAELERETGRHPVALRLFRDMARDDKNFDILADLNYEIGRTLQRMNRDAEALETYRQVLYNTRKPASGVTKAKTYYALGELSRFRAGDFQSAAIWFDSAARAAPDLTKLPEGFDAAELARSFGEYRRLTSEIRKADSLLWLASLPPARFDSVIESIRKKRIAEQEAELKKRQREANTATIVGGPQAGAPGQEAASAQNGFLNHKNPALVNQGMNQFRALWGSRPLVDNWRRMEAVRQSAVVQTESAGQGTAAAGQTAAAGAADIDLKPIPFTPASQDSMRNRLAAQHYELGNLFYLNLNLPDSAEYRYRLVIDRFPAAQSRANAFYVLAELLSAGGRETEAREAATLLTTQYPGSDLALRVIRRFRFPEEVTVAAAAGPGPDTIFHLLSDRLMNAAPAALRDTVHGFVRRYPDSPFAPELLLQFALGYARQGRQLPEFEKQAARFAEKEAAFERESAALRQLQDSARTVLAKKDSLRTPADSARLSDIVLAEPPVFNRDALFYYNGAPWDSTRAVLGRLRTAYPRYTQLAMVDALLKELQPPARPQAEKTIVQPERFAWEGLASYVEKSEAELFNVLRGKNIKFEIEVGEDGLPKRVEPARNAKPETEAKQLAALILRLVKWPAPAGGKPASITETWAAK